MEIIHKRECFVVGSSVFDTREEAEEFRLRSLCEADAVKVWKWVNSLGGHFVTSRRIAERLEEFGFFHDGVTR